MEPTFDATSEGLPLTVKKGVAAFDPVTLLLAAEKGTSKNIQVRLRPELDLPIPRALKGMAKVSLGIDPMGRLSISAVIDTGKMKWNLDGADAEHSCFEDYKAVGRRGVELGYLPVLNSDKSMVTHAPMKTPKGKPVTCWFTELPQELDEFDGYDLLALAQGAMREMTSAQSLPDTFVTVPAQNLQYQAPVENVDIPEYPGTAVLQRFAATLDEHGARVIAETFMDLAAIPADLPPTYEFGSKGPVLFWFTEPDCSTPFSIMYTTSDAWPHELDYIDLASVKLPDWD